jgi:hypothetical protein
VRNQTYGEWWALQRQEVISWRRGYVRKRTDPGECLLHDAGIVGSVFTQAFHLAVTRLGNVDALAQLLGVEVRTVHNWLYGSQMPPFKYFLRVIDIITSDLPEDPYVRAAPDSDEPPRK